jgi:hypothetical protein
MAWRKLQDDEDYTDEHLVVHVPTGDLYACDTFEESQKLAKFHEWLEENKARD